MLKHYQFISNFYLINEIPDNWENLTEENQKEFILNNVWEPFENYSEEQILEWIDNDTEVLTNYIKNN